MPSQQKRNLLQSEVEHVGCTDDSDFENCFPTSTEYILHTLMVPPSSRAASVAVVRSPRG